ncbi:MAG: hypothetical protein U0237_08700 [Thermoleophilia bacterium]
MTTAVRPPALLPHPALASMDAVLAAPLRELAVAVFAVACAGKEPGMVTPASSGSEAIIAVSEILAAQPGETRKASRLVPELSLPVEEAAQVLAASGLIIAKQRGSTDLAWYLTRRGARALASPDPLAWISAPADP